MFQWLVPQFLWDLCGQRDTPEGTEEKSNLLGLSAAKTRRALKKGLISPGPWDPHHWPHAIPSRYPSLRPGKTPCYIELNFTGSLTQVHGKRQTA